MIFGEKGSRDLDGFPTMQDWLLAKAELAVQQGARLLDDIVFIVPLVGTVYRVRGENMGEFKKKIAKCSALSITATRRELKKGATR